MWPCSRSNDSIRLTNRITDEYREQFLDDTDLQDAGTQTLRFRRIAPVGPASKALKAEFLFSIHQMFFDYSYFAQSYYLGLSGDKVFALGKNNY